MKTRWIIGTAITLVSGSWLAAVANAGGGQKELPMQAQQAKEQVSKHLDKIGGLNQATVLWLDDAALKEAFPSVTFFAVRYRKYPISVAVPPGLSSANVFAIGKGDKLKTVTNPDDLPKFFSEEFQAAKIKVNEKNAVALARAWLRLQEELLQDGFYEFETVKAEAKKNAKNGYTAEARAMATKGGNGDVTVSLEFGPDGSLTADQKYKLQPGPRPKCQATKLLDPDPIVRYMAETELLYMGVAARPYLLEQRARAANPQLADAIGRLLQRIEAIGW